MPPSTIMPPAKTLPVKTEPRFTRAQLQSAVNQATSRIRAKYDAAMTTAENQKHWANADSLSPSFAANPRVRETLRNRGRYEWGSNSYCKGIVSTMCNDLIGTGPRKQVLTDNAQNNRVVEREFSLWTEEVDLANKLKTMHSSRATAGDGLLMFVNNPGLGGPVQLDIKGFEPEQLTTYAPINNDPLQVDGITFDRYGNPKTYWVLPYHPGGSAFYGAFSDPRPIPAADVLHWFREERFGQARGIPDLTPALPLFAQLRRYTLATIMAAEIAAELSVFIESTLPAGSTAADLADGMTNFELVDLVRGMMTTMPLGWKANAFKPEQPTQSYGDFCDKILREILNCLEMPFGLGVGDFSASNYSSGRLDVERYRRKIVNERASLNRLLNRIFARWLEEAMWIPGLLPAGLPPFRQFRGSWNWDGFNYIDPLKEAQAEAIRLEACSTSLDEIYANRGKDWTEELPKIAAVRDLMTTLRIPIPGGTSATTIAQDASSTDSTNIDTTNADLQGVANVA